MEASAGDKAAEAHVNALARISELEEVVGGHAAARLLGRTAHFPGG